MIWEVFHACVRIHRLSMRKLQLPDPRKTNWLNLGMCGISGYNACRVCTILGLKSQWTNDWFQVILIGLLFKKLFNFFIYFLFVFFLGRDRELSVICHCQRNETNIYASGSKCPARQSNTASRMPCDARCIFARLKQKQRRSRWKRQYLLRTPPSAIIMRASGGIWSCYT